MEFFIRSLYWLGGSGLILTLITHLLALCGVTLVARGMQSLLMTGMTVLLFSWVWVIRKTVACNNSDVQGHGSPVPGTPIRVKWLIAGGVLYAFLNGSFLAEAIAGKGIHADAAMLTAAILPVYLYCTTQFRILVKKPWLLRKKRCPNGHEMARFADFCGYCGAPLIDDTGEPPP